MEHIPLWERLLSILVFLVILPVALCVALWLLLQTLIMLAGSLTGCPCGG